MSSYAKENDWDVKLGGLLIDQVNPYLAAFPTAFGYRIVSSRRTIRNSRGAATYKSLEVIFEVVTYIYVQNTTPKVEELPFLKRQGDGRYKQKK